MQIFIQDATLLDCAVLLPNQGPVGKSWSVDINWHGKQNEEGMLFDFALAKKIAKQTIDHEFDHKILVKSSQIKHQSHSKIIVGSNFFENEKEMFFAINTYNNSVKKVSRETIKALELNDLNLLELDIAQDILRNSPKNIDKVTVKLKKSNNHMMPNYYNYTHSLCKHVGNCQRFHGHSSAVEIYYKHKLDEQKSKDLAQFLNNKYIISKDYILNDWNSNLIQEIIKHCNEVEDNSVNLVPLQYSGSQGQIAIIISKEKVISLNYESTVENLAYFISSQLNPDPNLEVRAFEGLCKGAIFP